MEVSGLANPLQPPRFSLVDEAWIPVLDTAGQRREVSLLGLFEQAGDLRMIACELPTQTFAILRLGAVVVNVNPSYTARELLIILADSTPRVIITLDALVPLVQESRSKTTIETMRCRNILRYKLSLGY